MLFVVRLFQIRQEKPYYIADPEVDSLVSSIFHIKFLRPGSYPCVRPRTNTYALWIKLFVVVLKNFYISGSQSVGRDKNSKVNEPAPGHEFKWLLVTFAWEPLSNGARKKKHTNTHTRTQTPVATHKHYVREIDKSTRRQASNERTWRCSIIYIDTRLRTPIKILYNLTSVTDCNYTNALMAYPVK